jgi:hypothetical protein
MEGGVACYLSLSNFMKRTYLKETKTREKDSCQEQLLGLKILRQK